MRSNFKKIGLSIALSIGASTGATAATEDLLSDNGALERAQFVGSVGGFSTPETHVFGYRGNVSNSIYDNSDADFYRFEVLAPSSLTLTVSTPEGYRFANDSVLGLFSIDGRLLGVDDDGAIGYDSQLSRTIGIGTYVAAVSGFSDFAFHGGGSTNFIYDLAIVAAPSAVPLPPSLLCFIPSLLGIVATRRTRRDVRC